MFGKSLHELFVGKGGCLVFIVDQLPEQVVHLLDRYLLALCLGYTVAEEVAKGEDAEAGLYVFADGGA